MFHSKIDTVCTVTFMGRKIYFMKFETETPRLTRMKGPEKNHVKRNRTVRRLKLNQAIVVLYVHCTYLEFDKKSSDN